MDEEERRRRAMELLGSGRRAGEVCEALGRSGEWLAKWLAALGDGRGRVAAGPPREAAPLRGRHRAPARRQDRARRARAIPPHPVLLCAAGRRGLPSLPRTRTRPRITADPSRRARQES